MSYLFVASVQPSARIGIVRDAISKYLRENIVPGEMISTHDLMSALWPCPTAADFTAERKDAVNIALKLARIEFKGICAMQGPPDPKRKYMGKPVRHWLWYHPEEKPVGICPTCGQSISVATK